MFPRLRQIRLNRKALFIAAPVLLPVALFAQAPPLLTLQQAEEMAIKNHPQIQAAQNEVNFANQQIVINRLTQVFHRVDVSSRQLFDPIRLADSDGARAESSRLQ